MVFNIQRFSIHDGPGIRTTVFLKGCPLQCLWCSNPESQSNSAEISHSDLLCRKCGRCVAACETKAVSLTGDVLSIDRDRCGACGKCVETCPNDALGIYGKEMSVEEVFQEVERDRGFYLNSGGGVTVSGGEALAQPGFVAELFGRCGDEAIHTCLDTSGHASAAAWHDVLPLTDLVLFDLKHMDSLAHERTTGASNEKILDSLNLVVESGKPLIIRIPIVPGINDGPENVEAIARHVAGLKTVRKVNLMPYHRFGEGKYAMLGRSYSLAGLEPPGEVRLEGICSVFRSAGLECEVVN